MFDSMQQETSNAKDKLKSVPNGMTSLGPLLKYLKSFSIDPATEFS